ncbi:MAG: hypothetical protein M3Y35_13575 [Actinomycetota bacterium]|nr:hypothetical protein [Actinomycetota bacterium]
MLDSDCYSVGTWIPLRDRQAALTWLCDALAGGDLSTADDVRTSAACPAVSGIPSQRNSP